MREQNVAQQPNQSSCGPQGIQESCQKMICQAYEIGPHTVLFTEGLWREAVQEATWNSLDLFQLVRWYSIQRVERAIAQAMHYGVRRIEGLRYILEEGLDEYERREDADLDGQLLLPLGLPQAPETRW